MPLSMLSQLDDAATVKRETMLAIQNAKTLTSYALYEKFKTDGRNVLLLGQALTTLGQQVKGTSGVKLLAEGQLVYNENKLGLTFVAGRDKAAAQKALVALFREWKAPYRVQFASSTAPSEEESAGTTKRKEEWEKRGKQLGDFIRALKATMADARSDAPTDWAEILDNVEDLAAMVKAESDENTTEFTTISKSLVTALKARKKLETEWEPRLDEHQSLTRTAAIQRRGATKKTEDTWKELDTALLELTALTQSITPEEADRFDILFAATSGKLALTAAADIGERKRIAKLQGSTAPVVPEPDFDDCVLVATDGIYRVFLDSHQNKHQSTMIGELGTWKSKMGSRFAAGRGLQWHKDNTAQTVLAWAKAEDVQEGQKVIASKTTPLDDGNIYDASATNDGNFIVVVYHCNPPKDE